MKEQDQELDGDYMFIDLGETLLYGSRSELENLEPESYESVEELLSDIQNGEDMDEVYLSDSRVNGDSPEEAYGMLGRWQDEEGEVTSKVTEEEERWRPFQELTSTEEDDEEGEWELPEENSYGRLRPAERSLTQ